MEYIYWIVTGMATGIIILNLVIPAVSFLRDKFLGKGGEKNG